MTRRLLQALLVAALVASATTIAGASRRAASTDTKPLEQLLKGLKADSAASKAFDGTQILSAVPTGFGFLAAGVTDGHLSLWTSKNGRAWKRVPDAQVAGAPALPDPGLPTTGLPIAADKKGAIVLVDWDEWFTGDGRTFEHIDASQSGLHLGQAGTIAAIHLSGDRPEAVAVGTPGAVAVGAVCWCSSEGGGYPFYSPGTWVSTDRKHWTGTAMRPAHAPAGDVHAVISVGGQFVMAGADSTDTTSQGGDQAGLWRSRDGTTWTPVGGASVTLNTSINQLAADGKTVVGSGYDSTNVAAIWRSTDAGATWARVKTDPKTFPVGSGITELVANDDGFIAIGKVSGRPNGEDVIWVSGDGAHWKVQHGYRTKYGVPSLFVPSGKGLITFYAVGADVVPPGQTTVSISGKLPS